MNKIIVKNLTIKLSNNIILDNVSFEIKENSITGVVGINGSGKTTLLKAICGLYQKQNGDVIISNLGSTFSAPYDKKAKIISWLPSTMFFPFNFSVFKILLLGRYPIHQGFPRTKDCDFIWQILDILEISNLAYKNIHELSSGEQQKVWIARALVSDTEIIILDEPFSNLDFVYSLKLLKILKNLSLNSQKTIILSLHNIALGQILCTHFVGMKDKKTFMWDNVSLNFTQKYLKKIFSYDFDFDEYKGFDFDNEKLFDT